MDRPVDQGRGNSNRADRVCKTSLVPYGPPGGAGPRDRTHGCRLRAYRMYFTACPGGLGCLAPGRNSCAYSAFETPARTGSRYTTARPAGCSPTPSTASAVHADRRVVRTRPRRTTSQDPALLARCCARAGVAGSGSTRWRHRWPGLNRRPAGRRGDRPQPGWAWEFRIAVPTWRPPPWPRCSSRSPEFPFVALLVSRPHQLFPRRGRRPLPAAGEPSTTPRGRPSTRRPSSWLPYPRPELARLAERARRAVPVPPPMTDRRAWISSAAQDLCI